MPAIVFTLQKFYLYTRYTDIQYLPGSETGHITYFTIATRYRNELAKAIKQIVY